MINLRNLNLNLKLGIKNKICELLDKIKNLDELKINLS